MDCSEKTFACCFDEDTNFDAEIMGDGVNFFTTYIGCIEIFTSMKLLDFHSRSLVAKECINRVCEIAKIKTPKKRKVEKRIQSCISTEPCLEHTGANVLLNISAQSVELTSVETSEIISKHDMPNISFASGGDSDCTNYVAYVAKDTMGWRACYVIDCGHDRAPSVIRTLGQAFELRYKNVCGEDKSKPHGSLTRKKSLRCDGDGVTEYYNDMPNKMPPEDFGDRSCSEKTRERIHSNLIDLNTSLEQRFEYVNESFSDESGINYNNNNITNAPALMPPRDVFDMQCFSLSPEVHNSQLMLENWFHGKVDRCQAEALLRHDGDFLVRESPGASNQYVLTGLNSNQPRHLLLIDPEGVVRTKDRVFESISHLINYHWSNHLPIISAESALLLQTPVIRTNDLRRRI